MPAPSLTQMLARLADRALAPRDAVRNAAAAAFELSEHTKAWRDGLTSPVLLHDQAVEPLERHPSQG